MNPCSGVGISRLPCDLCAPEHPEADPNFNMESGAHGHFGSAAWHSASTTYSQRRGLAADRTDGLFWIPSRKENIPRTKGFWCQSSPPCGRGVGLALMCSV